MVDSIGSNIISTLGAGSGINSNSLAKQLTEIERTPKQDSIDSTREKLETQISDFGLVRSSLSTLQDSANLLKDTASFNSKTASFSDSDAFIPISLNEDVPTGAYSFRVLDVAASQSLSTSSTYADPTDAIGKGTLTVSFGAWDTGVPPSSFTQNTDADSLVVTISDGNNSLNGLRDAINAEDAGVTATIVNNGSGYHLLLTSDSGLSQQMAVSVEEDVTDPGLSAFEFNETTQNLDQKQAGKDARLEVNGLEVSRSQNEIDDVIDGFKFNLAKPDPGTTVNVTISEDKATGEQVVRDFVDSYNAFLEAIEPAIGFNEEEDENGSLYRDPTATSIVRQIRNMIGNSVPGLDDSGYTALTNVGIRTELDGTLSINEDDMGKAFGDNYELVKALFSPQTASSSDKIVVNSFRDTSVPGDYEVAISQSPRKGEYIGGSTAGSLIADLGTAYTAGSYAGGTNTFAGGLDLATQGKAAGDYDFELSVDGAAPVTISLPIADYADQDAIATALQSQIDEAGLKADITFSVDKFVISSQSSGSNSSIAVTPIGTDAGEFDFAAGSATAGTGPNADDYDFTVNVNGTTSGTISLARGSYTDENELAAHIEAQINSDATLSASGADVDVTWNTDHFEIVSRKYGADSKVIVAGIGAQMADLGLDSGASSSGRDVSGTWNGVAGFGVGNVLLPKLDSDPYGLSLIVQEGASSATITYSRGFGSELSELIDAYLERNGVLDAREETIDNKIDDLDEDQSDLDRRMDAYYERMISQFQAMESIINSINSSSSALDDIGSRLPFTAQNN